MTFGFPKKGHVSGFHGRGSHLEVTWFQFFSGDGDGLGFAIDSWTKALVPSQREAYREGISAYLFKGI